MRLLLFDVDGTLVLTGGAAGADTVFESLSDTDAVVQALTAPWD